MNIHHLSSTRGKGKPIKREKLSEPVPRIYDQCDLFDLQAKEGDRASSPVQKTLKKRTL